MLTPRPYQVEGAEWLRDIRRGFLTDHPGLGKTLTATLAAETPCYISVPAYHVEHWEDALNEQFEGQAVVAATGTRSERTKALGKRADFMIGNHEMLPSYDIQSGYRTFIVDEAHHLRNRTARKSLAAARIMNENHAARIYLLTASPMWKQVDDIWMQLNILFPTIFTSYHEFVNTYCITDRSAYGVKVLGVRGKMRGPLKELLAPFRLGRTYKDVGRFLPEKIETVHKLKLSKERREIYDQLMARYKVQWQDEDGRKQLIFQGPALLHALRQVTFCPEKIDAIKGIIEDSGKQTLIYNYYRDHAEQMAKAMGKDCVFVSGHLDPQERRKVALQAQADGKHISATIRSLEEGINLSKMRQVVYGEEHWPPGSNFQSESRVIRDRNDDGKDQEPVNAHYVMMRRTSDEIVHNVSRRRSGSIKDVVAECMV